MELEIASWMMRCAATTAGSSPPDCRLNFSFGLPVLRPSSSSAPRTTRCTSASAGLERKFAMRRNMGPWLPPE